MAIDVKTNSIERSSLVVTWLLYLLTGVSVIGAHIVSVDIRVMSISLYRGLLIVIVCVFLASQFLSCKQKRFRYQQECWYLIFFNSIWLVFSVISAFWAKDMTALMKSVFFIATGALINIVLVYYLDEKKKILGLLYTFLIVIIYSNLVGWFELIIERYYFVDSGRAKYYAHYDMPVSTMGNTNDFGLLMLFGVFISGTVFFLSRSRLIKLSCLAIAASSIILCTYTRSRASLFGIGIGLLTLVLIQVFRSYSLKKMAVFFLIPILVIASVIAWPILSTEYDAIQSGIQNETGSNYIRVNLIKNGVDFLVQTGGFGVGAGNVEYWMSHYAKHSTLGIINIHNWWLEILVGYGLLVFIGYLIMYGLMIRKLIWMIRFSKDRQLVIICTGMLCIMLGFTVGAISSSSNINKEWLWLFWAFVITVINYAYLNQHERK